jgi:hypothetical protein
MTTLVLRLRLHRTIPPLPPHILMVWCLTKEMDNFTFALTIVKYADKRTAHMQQYTHLHCVAMGREICEYAAQQKY